MAEILRLADADEASLRARVARIVRQHGGECAVDHFVVWYTTRPPVHAAIIFVHAQADATAGVRQASSAAGGASARPDGAPKPSETSDAPGRRTS